MRNTLDATAELADIRERRRALRKRRYRPSLLGRYRAELVALRQAGASYRELAEWLRREKRRRVHPSTIHRFLARQEAGESNARTEHPDA